MAKVSKPILYTGILAIGVIAYNLMSGGSPASKSSITAAARGGKNSKTDVYLPEDYKAHFSSLTTPAKDAFAPLVARTTLGGGVGPDSVPVDMAGGDPNWVYTGVSEVNGSTSVLFENRVTMESEFAAVGERWKNCTVGKVEGGKVTLSSHTGKKVQLRLAEQTDQVAVNSAPGNNGLQPVNPALSGPIGGRNVGIRPENPRASTRGRNTQEQSDAN